MDKLTDLLFACVLLIAVSAAATDRLSAIHLALAYLFLVAIALNQYDYRDKSGISPLLSLQVALTFALGTLLMILVVGGLGFRTLELVAVFCVLFAFVLARDDLRSILPVMAPYLAAFGVVFMIFLYHAREFSASSGTGMFPVLAGIILAGNLFVIPRYVSEDAVYWSTTVIGVAGAALGLAAILIGDYSLWIFEVGTWDGTTTLPLLDRELPIVRSIFANPNTLGILLFPGTVAAYIATHRTLRLHPPLAIVSASAFSVLAAGLYLTNSRASILGAAVAIAVYTIAITDRRLLPGALIGVGIGVPVFLALIYYSVLPIDSANRFELWRASLEAIRAEGTLLGEGIISTREAIEPYLAEGVGSYTSHNSYLSIFIRIGVIGGLGYVLLVLGPIVQGLFEYDRVNVGMLSIAVGFAVHQLFEGYTLYQFGPGSIFGALVLGYVIASLAGEDGATPATIAGTSPSSSAETTALAVFDRGTDVTYQTENHDDQS